MLQHAHPVQLNNSIASTELAAYLSHTYIQQIYQVCQLIGHAACAGSDQHPANSNQVTNP